MTTPDPVLAFCERSFSAILELTCIVQAILPNVPDGTEAKRRLTYCIEALAEPMGKIREANARSGSTLTNNTGEANGCTTY